MLPLKCKPYYMVVMNSNPEGSLTAFYLNAAKYKFHGRKCTVSTKPENIRDWTLSLNMQL